MISRKFVGTSATIVGLVLSSPIYSQDLTDNIKNLEISIVKKLKKDYNTNFPKISLDDSLQANIILEYKSDNKNTPCTFQLAIGKKTKDNKIITLEYYIDNNLDGIKQYDKNDEYHSPEPLISKSIGSYRFNRIPTMNANEIKNLNKQYMQRLKQINNALKK